MPVGPRSLTDSETSITQRARARYMHGAMGSSRCSTRRHRRGIHGMCNSEVAATSDPCFLWNHQQMPSCRFPAVRAWELCLTAPESVRRQLQPHSTSPGPARPPTSCQPLCPSPGCEATSLWLPSPAGSGLELWIT
jgi:hypothetical protein